MQKSTKAMKMKKMKKMEMEMVHRVPLLMLLSPRRFRHVCVSTLHCAICTSARKLDSGT